MARDFSQTVRVFRFARQIFRDTFETSSGRMALARIRTICGADLDTPVFHADPMRMAANAARQDVWREIVKHVRLSDEDIDRAAREASARSVGGDL